MEASFFLANSVGALGIYFKIFSDGLPGLCRVGESRLPDGWVVNDVCSSDGSSASKVGRGWRDTWQWAVTGPCCLIKPTAVTAIRRRKTEHEGTETEEESMQPQFEKKGKLSFLAFARFYSTTKL